jgi:abhydrolase domain-containing protein 17
VYRWLTSEAGWREADIIVCGRSIGSGPACVLASKHRPGSLVLISPHTSIRGVVKDQFLGSITQYIIAERFRNVDAIAKVVCPTFILHGLRDTLVSYSHSQVLCDTCGGPTFLLLPELMDHNSLDVIGDFIAPLNDFLENFGLSSVSPASLVQKEPLKTSAQGQGGQQHYERSRPSETPI